MIKRFFDKLGIWEISLPDEIIYVDIDKYIRMIDIVQAAARYTKAFEDDDIGKVKEVLYELRYLTKWRNS